VKKILLCGTSGDSVSKLFGINKDLTKKRKVKRKKRENEE